MEDSSNSLVSGAYGFYDRITGQCLYIGMSKNIDKRRKAHLNHLKNKTHRRKEFIEWFEEFGGSRLEHRILEICEPEDALLNVAEIKWFHLEAPKFFGKIPSLNEKWTHSDETRKKISETHKLLTRDSNLELECPSCGSVFKRKRHRADREGRDKNFCSKKCTYKSQIKTISKEREESLCREYLNGQNISYLFLEYDLPFRTVKKILSSNGIELRRTREEPSLSGKKSAHTRWHTRRSIFNPECVFCTDSTQ